MKKLIYRSMMIASLGMITISCQKEDIQPNTNATQTSQVENSKPDNSNNQEKANGNRRVFYDNGNPDGQDGIDYGCKGSGGNCLDDVVVTASLAADINVIGDLGDSGDNGSVIGVVTKNLLGLAKIVDISLLNQVLTGSLTLNVRGRVNVNETAYLLFKDGHQNIVSVRPVKM